MEGLGFSSILGGDEIENLFMPDDSSQQEEPEKKKEENPPKENKKEEETTEVVDPESLFEEEQPESVGSEEDKEENKEKEDPDSDTDDGASPTFSDDLFSSIAKACAEEGIFPDLDDETITKVKTPEDFRNLIESQINAGLDERQKRVNDALNNGVEPDNIRKYENTLNYLDTITEDAVVEESEKGEALRKSIIYQDYLNRGYSQQRATKLTERSIEAGTDIEDAKEALQSNKEYFKTEYDKLLQEAQDKADRAVEERKANVSKLKDSILKDKQLLGDIEIDSSMRRKVCDALTKPVYRDPNTGNYYTDFQKYTMEHGDEFLKYAGILYTMTNGFKDFDTFTKGKVKKEVKKGLKELEHTLNNTKRNTGGSLKLVTTAKDDPESFIGKGFKFDF